VASLIDKSLLQQTRQEGNEPRFAMLETISAYGQECLSAHREMTQARHAHAAYFLLLAQEAEPQLTGPQQVAWLERLEQEYENLRAALHWLEQQTGEESREQASRLTGALWRFWWVRGYWREGRNYLSSALKKSQGVVETVRAKALYGLGVLACSQNDVLLAEACCEESLALFRKLGDRQGIAASLYKLGQVICVKNDLQTAHALIEESLTLFRQMDDAQGTADTLVILALLYLDEGDYIQTQATLEESVALFQKVENMGGMIFSLITLASLSFLQNELVQAYTQTQQCLILSRKVGDRWNIARCLVVQALIAFAQGTYEPAGRQAEEALEMFKVVDAQEGIALALFTLGMAFFGQGDYAAARGRCEESLAIAIALNHKEYISVFPVGLAAVALALGTTCISLVEVQWAAQILAASEIYRETAGIPLPSIVALLQVSVEAAVRAQLGEELSAAMWSLGRSMTVEHAIAAQGRSLEARQTVLAAVERSLQPLTSYPAGLTAREVEVLRWTALGLTNIQIGEKLIISSRTVSTHLSSIYHKLGVSSRSAAARFAADHHLVDAPGL
jgi:DNA-binding CsgD family transcriptional regulator